ncbi:rRNA maturation RNase YbeY [Chloroflexota bacterium]
MEIDVLVDDEFLDCIEVKWVKRIVRQVLNSQNVTTKVEISIFITGLTKVQELNRNYRNEDRPTDVLAFATTEGVGEDTHKFILPPDRILHLGEVIIAYPQAVIQAKNNRHSVKRETAILIIHGVLHVLGYDHDNTLRELEMRAKEKEILGYFQKGLK